MGYFHLVPNLSVIRGSFISACLIEIGFGLMVSVHRGVGVHALMQVARAHAKCNGPVAEA